MAVNYDTFLIARQKLIDSISIPDYYMDYIDESINLDRYNKDCCPLHDEDTPSFFFIKDYNLFKCFGCEKSGSVVELHYHIQHRLDPSYTKARAIIDLSKLYGIEIPNIFQEAKLDDVKQFNNKNKKLSFKPKEALKKPKKKVELDIENKILKNKENLTKIQFKQLLDDIDEIFFIDGDIDSKIKEVEIILEECLKENLNRDV